MKTVLRHLRRAALLDRGDSPSDAHLLESFLTCHDEAAFEGLLRRHGPMVFGVCRRVLGNRADAEDAFQATFLVLVRKAAVIRPRELVGSWLWGVAYRTALKARAINMRRRTRERLATEMGRSDDAQEDWVSEELLQRLDEALGRLPEKYRVPLVLCELESRSRKEVARTLALPEGTLSWRLAQAKKMLARKLSRHGPVLSAGAVAAVLSVGATRAAVPPLLLRSTAKAGLRLAAGRALAGAVPSKVVTLTQGVLKAMLLTKLKVASWAVGVALFVGVGAVGMSYRASAQTFGPRESRNEQRGGVAPTPKVGRPAADDLESLRLEIDALRRELRATRDMVKALQAEVRGKKEAVARPEQDAEKRWRQDARKLEAEKLHRLEALRQDEGKLRQLDARKLEAEKLRRLETLRRKEALEALSRKEAAGPLAELEDAVKALRKDPKDKRAAEALDRALRRLKEQPKPNKPGPQGHNPIEF